MQPEASVPNDQALTSESSGWRSVLKIITILLVIFNVIMIIAVDLGGMLSIEGVSKWIPYKGFFLSTLYEIPPLLITLFAAFMKKDSLVTFVMAAATTAFFILVYLA